MRGHTWTVTDQTTGETFQYKRYAPSGAYYMKSCKAKLVSQECYVKSFLNLYQLQG